MADRTVLITGISGEIGGHLGHELAAEGWMVSGLDRRPLTGANIEHISFLECDLTDARDVEAKMETFHKDVGAFDAVINCAGQIANSPLISLNDGRLVHHNTKLWDDVLASCLSSAFYVTAAAVLKMAASAKKGVVINISSICSRGNPGQSAYSAAKAGINGLTAALGKELGPMGIRVVALAPGYFDTKSTRDNVPAARLKEIRTAIPVKRFGRLDEISNAVHFILSNQYVNGTVIELDGGLVL